MKAIILSAGQSSRLREYTREKPKCMVKVRELSILERQLNALDGLVDEVTIVVGYKREKVEEFISSLEGPSIEMVTNRHYLSTDNGYSLSLAIDDEDESVIILDGDIIFDPSILVELAECPNALVVDDSRIPAPEDCKVQLKHGYATGIGKEKPYGYVYSSMARLDGSFLQGFRDELAQNNEWYSEPLDRVLKHHPNKILPIFTMGRMTWEIDTEDDLEEAGRICDMM